MRRTHLAPLTFVHSSITLRWASLWSVETPQPAKSRSAASAPHCLFKSVSVPPKPRAVALLPIPGDKSPSHEAPAGSFCSRQDGPQGCHVNGRRSFTARLRSCLQPM
jgi:hypothetical protein